MTGTDGTELDRFAWVDDSPIGTTGCVTFVEAVELAGLAERFGGRLPGPVQWMPLDRIRGVHGDEPAIALRALGRWTVAVEGNGFAGSRPEALRRVSVGTRALNVFWSVDAVARVGYAVAGEILTGFDVLEPDLRAGAEPDVLEEIRRGLSRRPGQLAPYLLALAARVTGAPLVEAWLDGDFAVVRL